MRLWIFAIGHQRGTPEGMLVDDFCDRARKLGRNMGFTAVSLEELPVSKHRDVAVRMKDEAERLSSRLPEGAHLVLLDARGKGMTSEDFAEMLGSLRDVGTKDTGTLFGAHGGALDRVDAALFALVAGYYVWLLLA